ncbi:hypothetical protein GUJ93_ZPchr0004g38206 [Zizania palustris]|uniref:Uncharacterized protein n=1 Tax=Zizania palustris TaxID=103762 RepID=A0A8J5SBI7_ZIZPA|nr:hypothetical protein GUJ93_ZPchr0004g38206 [Zizania palustris]
MPCEVTTYPKNTTRSMQNVHFSRLPNNLASRRTKKTACRYSTCSVGDLL